MYSMRKCYKCTTPLCIYLLFVLLNEVRCLLLDIIFKYVYITHLIKCREEYCGSIYRYCIDFFFILTLRPNYILKFIN